MPENKLFPPEGLRPPTPCSLPLLQSAAADGSILEGCVDRCDGELALHLSLDGIRGYIPPSEVLSPWISGAQREISVLSRVGRRVCFTVQSVTADEKGAPLALLSRADAQERALRGGMRGVAFSALLGLADFRKDALASALHVYYLQRKYPAAEMSLSCPRLRPIINNDKINPLDVGERQLCQVLCAYRIFLPFVGITVSSREDAAFRNGIVRIAATKVSAGVSTGIGDHESKYQGKEAEDAGDEQFEISDSRSLSQMYQDMAAEGLQPVLNDYLYV